MSALLPDLNSCKRVIWSNDRVTIRNVFYIKEVSGYISYGCEWFFFKNQEHTSNIIINDRHFSVSKDSDYSLAYNLRDVADKITSDNQNGLRLFLRELQHHLLENKPLNGAFFKKIDVIVKLSYST